MSMYQEKLHVCWISNAPSPYKVAFMNELASSVRLTCLFEMTSEQDREQSWYQYQGYQFEAIYLDEQHWKQQILQQVNRCDVLIDSDYTHRYARFATKVFHHAKKPTCESVLF